MTDGSDKSIPSIAARASRTPPRCDGDRPTFGSPLAHRLRTTAYLCGPRRKVSRQRRISADDALSPETTARSLQTMAHLRRRRSNSPGQRPVSPDNGVSPRTTRYRPRRRPIVSGQRRLSAAAGTKSLDNGVSESTTPHLRRQPLIVSGRWRISADNGATSRDNAPSPQTTAQRLQTMARIRGQCAVLCAARPRRYGLPRLPKRVPGHLKSVG
jgi:hypothetical protein